MIPIEETTVLGTNLDCQGFSLLNVKALDPVPPPLISADDPRLSDQRPVPTGSVTDLSVASVANIAQSKLNFNGNPPAAWLGNSKNQFARGDLVQLKAQKNVAGGYVGLDVNGLVPASAITAGGGGGKVNSVGLVMPKELSVANSPVTTNGTLAVTWVNVANSSWFGAAGATVLGPANLPITPSFITSLLPGSLIPSLDASKFTTGVFILDRLPIMLGVGTGHAPGLVSDPGENGDPNDYLGRDGKWKAFVMNVSYQPTLPDVSIAANSISEMGVSVTIRTNKGVVLFYRINGGEAPDNLFTEVHVKGTADSKITLTLNPDDFVEAYAAKAGYNNSNIATYLVGIPSSIPGG